MKDGYITLISTLIVGAVGLAIATSLLLMGLGNSKTAQASQQTAQAKSMADYCAEVALLNLHDNLNYYGGDNIADNDVSCTIVTVTGKGNRSRMIEAVGYAGHAVRKVEVQIDRVRPQIKLISWKEVADF